MLDTGATTPATQGETSAFVESERARRAPERHERWDSWRAPPALDESDSYGMLVLGWPTTRELLQPVDALAKALHPPEEWLNEGSRRIRLGPPMKADDLFVHAIETMAYLIRRLRWQRSIESEELRREAERLAVEARNAPRTRVLPSDERGERESPPVRARNAFTREEFPVVARLVREWVATKSRLRRHRHEELTDEIWKELLQPSPRAQPCDDLAVLVERACERAKASLTQHAESMRDVRAVVRVTGHQRTGQKKRAPSADEAPKQKCFVP